MKQELEHQLYQRYPAFFVQRHLPLEKSPMCLGFTCGDGWFTLIDSFCAEVERLLEESADSHFEITQVKSKLNTLRIYFQGGDERMRAMANLVRSLSEKINEEDGKLRIL